MVPWWLVRSVEQVGRLTSQEWGQLAAAGRRLDLGPRQQLAWGRTPGVFLVGQGNVRLSTEGWPLCHTTELATGDLVGTRAPLPCRIDAASRTTLHLFHHDEWLAVLGDAPLLTRKLLRGLACSAVQAEPHLFAPASVRAN